jgi:hypothetical protein
MRDWIKQHAVATRSVVWGGLGVCCFAVAFSLTWSVSHVTSALSATAPDRLEKDYSAWYSIAVIASNGTVTPAGINYDYTLQDKVAVLTLALPPGAREINIAAQETRCWVSVAGELSDGLLQRDNGDYKLLKVPEAITKSGGSVDCNVDPRLLRNSFTTFVSAFYNDPRGATMDDPTVVALPLNLTFNRREGPIEIAASNSKATLGDTIVLDPGGFVAARFESMHLGEQRDWYILIIGVLIGFGAAMIIEAFRPLIDRIGREP